MQSRRFPKAADLLEKGSRYFTCKLLFTITTIHVECQITGSTPNDYRDIRSNNYVRIEDGTLSIGNIQKSHEGYYLCEASNGIGAGLSAVIFVSVQGLHCLTFKNDVIE